MLGAIPRRPKETTAGLRTSCYDEYMSVNVSVRLDDALAERLRLRARAAGETLSDRLRRYAEEGTRREEHPLITSGSEESFEDGGVYSLRVGLVDGRDHAIVSAMVAVHGRGNEVLWSPPEAAR